VKQKGFIKLYLTVQFESAKLEL